MLHPRGNTLGHSADDEIVVIRFHQAIVEDLFDRLLLGYALVVGIQWLIRSIQKLVKGQRMNVQKIDHSHGIGFRLSKERSEQTACGDHMVFVCLFLKVFQSVKRRRALLYLIKYNKGCAGKYLLSRNQGKQFYDPLGILICFKDRLQFVFFVEVEIYVIIVITSAELFHKPSLTDLTGALQYHRLAFFVIFPFKQCSYRISLHTNHLTNMCTDIL